MNVADENGALFAKFLEARGEVAEKGVDFFRVGDFVGADVNDGGTGADPIRLDVAGLAHGGDDDIGASDDVGEVTCFRVADGDRGVGMHKEERHGLADDVAASEDDGVCAFGLNIVAAQDFHATGGRAGDESRASADQATEADGMKAVNVFCGIDGFENALGVDLSGEGKLDENAVDGVVAVQFANETEQLVGGNRGGRGMHPAGEAELLTGGDFGFNVELGSGIFAYEDRR